MAITQVSGAHIGAALGANGGTTGTITTTGVDLFLAYLSWDKGGTGLALLDSKSNVWTGLTANTGNANVAGRLYYATNVGAKQGTLHTFTVSGTSVFASLCVAGFAGAHLTAPFDQENGANNTGFVSHLQSGSVTPAGNEDNELVVSGAGGGNGFAGSYSCSGYTVLDGVDFGGGSNYGSMLSYLIQTTAGATNPDPTWNVGTSNTSVSLVATFHSAAGGGGGSSIAAIMNQYRQRRN